MTRTGARRKLSILREASGSRTVQLFCVPPVGENPDFFFPWVPALRSDVELIAVRLPGHGPRLGQRSFDRWDALVEDTIEGLEPYLAEPHAFYGHCFGGRLAYELTHVAGAVPGSQTRRLFVSCCRSPGTPHAGRYLYQLPDAQLIDVMREWGAPDEVLRDATVRRLLLPVIRDELRLAELWDDRHGAGVGVPITAFCGRHDADDGPTRMEGWRQFSVVSCEFFEFPGDRSFFEADPIPLLDVINDRLSEAA